MNKKTGFIVGILVLIVIGLVAYGAMTMPDQRSAGEKIGDAVTQMDEGLDDAARELEDRTPAERVSDEFEDATDGSPQ